MEKQDNNGLFNDVINVLVPMSLPYTLVSFLSLCAPCYWDTEGLGLA